MVFSLVVSSASGQSGRSNVIGVGSIRGVAASSAILRARSTLCSTERDEVDWIIDRSSGLSPTRSHR